jgi:hypothetical protein
MRFGFPLAIQPPALTFYGMGNRRTACSSCGISRWVGHASMLALMQCHARVTLSLRAVCLVIGKLPLHKQWRNACVGSTSRSLCLIERFR